MDLLSYIIKLHRSLLLYVAKRIIHKGGGGGGCEWGSWGWVDGWVEVE